ncbi:hypothetical protein [Microcystis phage Mwe-JY26]
MSFTPILSIEQVAPNQNSVEVTINDAILALEGAANALLSVNLSAANVTLTATQWRRNFFFRCTGHSVARTLFIPVGAASRFLAVQNDGTGSVELRLAAAAPGSGVTVPPGGEFVIFFDGTNPVSVGGGGASGGGSTALGFALSPEADTLTAGLAAHTFRMPYAMTLTGVRASLSAASVSGVVEVDINMNGVSIFSTRLTIDANEKTSLTALVPAVLSTTVLTDDAEITFDVDSAGTNAVGLKVWLIGTINP